MSILRTAIANGLEPYQYLKTLFDEISKCKTVADFETLLPWNIQLNDKLSVQFN